MSTVQLIFKDAVSYGDRGSFEDNAVTECLDFGSSGAGH
jgi:hypothetical protein